MTDAEDNTSDIEIEQDEVEQDDDDLAELEKRQKEKTEALKKKLKDNKRPKRDQTNIKMVFGKAYEEFGPGAKLFKCAEFLATTKYNGKDDPEEKLGGREPKSDKQRKAIISYKQTKKMVDETLPTLDEAMKTKLKAAYADSKAKFGVINDKWKEECKVWANKNEDLSDFVAENRKKKRNATDKIKKDRKSTEMALPGNALNTVTMISDLKTFLSGVVNQSCDDFHKKFVSMLNTQANASVVPRLTV